ncbi:MAG: hypothetical protein ABII00_18740 [Elusimicrobiota bacterium]
MREYTLKIRFSSKLKDWGQLKPDAQKGNHYLLRIDESAPLIKQVGTILHEFGHMIFYMIFAPEAIDEKREHRFCRKMDESGQRGFQRYLEGK